MTSIVAMLPTSVGGVPWNTGFAWKYVNYTILVVPGALILLWIYWHLSVKNWFTGPKTTVDLPAGVSSADEIAAEHAAPHPRPRRRVARRATRRVRARRRP